MGRIVNYHNGFHGYTKFAFNGDDYNLREVDNNTYYVVSQATARRLNKLCCPCTGCQCGERIAVAISPDEFGVLKTDDAIFGNYPQS